MLMRQTYSILGFDAQRKTYSHLAYFHPHCRDVFFGAHCQQGPVLIQGAWFHTRLTTSFQAREPPKKPDSEVQVLIVSS